jgi:pimeloyl-ACP methyl ester carboxylesterase
VSKTKHSWFKLSAIFISLLVIAFLVICAILANSRAMNLVHPERTLPLRTPTDVGIDQWFDVRFSTSDGLKLAAWFVPAESDGLSPTLIFIHGFGSNREELLDQTKLTHDHGYNALLLDLRNHGQSQGEITTFGYQEVIDVKAALEYLLARPDVDPDRIGLVGHSMGGAVAIRAAAQIPLVKATVVESSFTSLEDNIEQGVRVLTGLPPFPFAPLVVWFGEREAGSTIHLIRHIDDLAQITPRAILFIHGELDALVDVSNSHNLYNAAGEPKELYIVQHAGHGGLYETNPEEFENRVISFLDQYLK